MSEKRNKNLLMKSLTWISICFISIFITAFFIKLNYELDVQKSHLTSYQHPDIQDKILYHNESLENISVQKRQIWVNKKDGRRKEEPLIFVKGIKSYKQAKKKCEDLNARLALLEDLERAYFLGYHNCKRGWLLDKHTGYVVQKDNPPDKCKTNQTGVIYSFTKSKSRAYGAYCTSRKWFLPDKKKHRMSPSLNLWFRKDPAHLYKLRKDLQKRKTGRVRRSIRALYPCCNYLNIVPVEKSDGTSVTEVKLTKSEKSMRYLVNLAGRLFPETEPKVMPHIRMSFKAMCHYGAGTFNKSAVVDDIVSKAMASNVDGFMFDYEPHQDYTKKHAIIVRDFLNLLAKKMHEKKLEIGFCISDWGVLKFYEVYAKTNVDVFATMSLTYYGRDLDKNKKGVKKLLRAIDATRVQIGIKSVVHEPKDPVTGIIPEKVYDKPGDWTHRKLKDFVRWVSRYTEVTQLHVWPESWGRRSRTKAFFFRTLKGFTKTGVVHQIP